MSVRSGSRASSAASGHSGGAPPLPLNLTLYGAPAPRTHRRGLHRSSTCALQGAPLDLPSLDRQTKCPPSSPEGISLDLSSLKIDSSRSSSSISTNPSDELVETSEGLLILNRHPSASGARECEGTKVIPCRFRRKGEDSASSSPSPKHGGNISRVGSGNVRHHRLSGGWEDMHQSSADGHTTLPVDEAQDSIANSPKTEHDDWSQQSNRVMNIFSRSSSSTRLVGDSRSVRGGRREKTMLPAEKSDGEESARTDLSNIKNDEVNLTNTCDLEADRQSLSSCILQEKGSLGSTSVQNSVANGPTGACRNLQGTCAGAVGNVISEESNPHGCTKSRSLESILTAQLEEKPNGLGITKSSPKAETLTENCCCNGKEKAFSVCSADPESTSTDCACSRSSALSRGSSLYMDDSVQDDETWADVCEKSLPCSPYGRCTQSTCCSPELRLSPTDLQEAAFYARRLAGVLERALERSSARKRHTSSPASHGGQPETQNSQMPLPVLPGCSTGHGHESTGRWRKQRSDQRTRLKPVEDRDGVKIVNHRRLSKNAVQQSTSDDYRGTERHLLRLSPEVLRNQRAALSAPSPSQRQPLPLPYAFDVCDVLKSAMQHRRDAILPQEDATCGTSRSLSEWSI